MELRFYLYIQIPGGKEILIVLFVQIYTFGCNDEGALGRDTSEEGSETLPVKIKLPAKIVQVSAGDSHTAALSEEGRVFMWGNFRVRCND